jgi:hypothetical protein
MDSSIGKTVLYGESTAAETAATIVEGNTALSQEATFVPVRRGVACGARVKVFCASGQAWAVVEHLDVSGAMLHMPSALPHLSTVAIALPLPHAHGPTEGRVMDSQPSEDGGSIVEVTFVNVDEARRDDLAKVVAALKKLAAKRTPG